MFITVGGERKEAVDGLTVAGLIALEKVEMPEYVSVPVNEEFVQRDNFETHVLKDGDVVEFLYFMGGGVFAGEGC
ncbi:MAG: sulfur carrier protein ThiS [Fretibacterium sp.]|nr:sulfur carrier protein ThiS [Fretibacterium sp.]